MQKLLTCAPKSLKLEEFLSSTAVCVWRNLHSSCLKLAVKALGLRRFCLLLLY